MNQEQIQYLPLENIVSEPQVREQFNAESIEGLMVSLKEVGQLVPIRARQIEGGKYVIVDGERRVRAARLAGFKTISAIIEEMGLSKSAALHKQVVSNVQRDDLTPLEKAKAIAQVMATTGWNAKQVAAKLGLSNATTSRLLALLNLPEAILEKIASGKINGSAGYELVGISDPVQQMELALRLEQGGLTRDAVAATRKASRDGSKATGTAGLTRATATLGGGQSITVIGPSLTMEILIDLLRNLLGKAMKAKPQGVELPTFLKILKDQAQGSGA